jgi:hypothetical protein
MLEKQPKAFRVAKFDYIFLWSLTTIEVRTFATWGKHTQTCNWEWKFYKAK